MPAVSQGTDSASEDLTVERVISLLEEALAIIDRWPGSPALGARLQQVIEDAQELGTGE